MFMVINDWPKCHRRVPFKTNFESKKANQRNNIRTGELEATLASSEAPNYQHTRKKLVPWFFMEVALPSRLMSSRKSPCDSFLNAGNLELQKKNKLKKSQLVYEHVRENIKNR